MVNLEAARAGNLAAEFFAIWVEPTEWAGRYAHRTLQLIDGVYEQLRKHPQTMRLGLTPHDVLRAHADKVFCVLLGIEGGHSIEADLGLLRLYHRLGVRYMTLTWSNTNEWADSSGDIDNPDGHPSWWPHRIRSECGARDESTGNDGRRLPRCRLHLLGRPANDPRPRDRIPLERHER